MSTMYIPGPCRPSRVGTPAQERFYIICSHCGEIASPVHSLTLARRIRVRHKQIAGHGTDLYTMLGATLVRIVAIISKQTED
jgi:hypothetical protein